MNNELRLLVIGLDGATFDIIKPLIAQGRQPALSRLVAEGASGPLRSTIPPVSAPAWSTFMTGLNPGKHGIFQWRAYDPTKYTCLDGHLIISSRLAGRTFWDILGSRYQVRCFHWLWPLDRTWLHSIGYGNCGCGSYRSLCT